MIVEDYEPNVRLLEVLLEQAGCRHIKGTTDPREVPALVDEFAPDLMLLDLHMPNVDGFEVIDQIAARPEQNAPSILILTGDLTPEARAAAAARGVTEFLYKPLDINDVVHRVEKALS